MGLKLWVSFCTETMRKGEKLSSLPISTTVPELQGCSTKIFKCFLLEKGSSHLAKAQHPLHLLNISLYSSNISRNCIFFYLFQFSGYFPQLSFHTKSRFHSPPMDPVFLAPGWRRLAENRNIWIIKKPFVSCLQRNLLLFYCYGHTKGNNLHRQILCWVK